MLLFALTLPTQHRLGELLIDSCFEPASQISHSTIFNYGINANGLKYINYILCMKTKEKGNDINMMDSTCSCSATSALKHYLSSNTAIPAAAPLFLNGLTTLGGHSLREAAGRNYPRFSSAFSKGTTRAVARTYLMGKPNQTTRNPGSTP